MFNNKKLIVLCLFAIGCSTETTYVKTFTTPRGYHGVVVECEHEPDCWQIVGSSCPSGYVILDDKSLRSDTVANGRLGIHSSKRGVVAAECNLITTPSHSYGDIDKFDCNI